MHLKVQNFQVLPEQIRLIWEIDKGRQIKVIFQLVEFKEPLKIFEDS